MKRIEFIGASGVGKTTLLKEVIKARGKDDSWISVWDAKNSIVKKISYNSLLLKRNKILLFILRNNFLKYKEEGLVSKILEAYEADVSDVCLCNYNPLIEMFLSNVVNIHLEPGEKAKMICFYMRLLIQDYAMLDYFGVKDVVVFDEGAIHNNLATANLNLYVKMMEENSESYDMEKINPAGIIYCKLPLEEHVIRFKKRITKSNLESEWRKMDNNQLYKIKQKEQNEANDKVDVMKGIGVPVLEIDLSNSQLENIDKILMFIRSSILK